MVNDEDKEKEDNQTFWVLLEDNEQVFVKDFQAIATIVDDYTPPLPDFTITETEFVAPDTIPWGEQFQVSGTITNVTTVDVDEPEEGIAAVNPYYEIYLSDGDNTTEDVLLGSGWAFSSGSDRNKVYTFEQTVALTSSPFAENSFALEPDDYSLLLKVDPDNLEPEADETNNQTQTAIEVTALTQTLPDLVVSL